MLMISCLSSVNLIFHGFFILLPGYDGLPIESMQGLDINSSGNFNDSDLRNDQANYVNYNPNNNINARINNSNVEPPYVNTSQSTQNNEPLPNPPSDSNQVAAWYDTDL